jgi:UDP-N-acetylglucosamine 1-carboxyvinyltransferase
MESLELNTSGKIVVNGPQTAKGDIYISGSKNAVLPIMAACLLTDEKITLDNVPDLADVSTMIDILESAGKVVDRIEDKLIITSTSLEDFEIPYEPVRKMRASFNVFGPLTIKMKKAKVALPGGCSIGVRPVNFHLEGLKKLGIESKIEHGFALSKFNGAEKEVNISLKFPSVGATEHIITTATLIYGTKTIISNCAMEPEISDLIDFLNAMGADIIGKNTSTITVNGVDKLHGLNYRVIPDRIEAGTYAIMGALIGDNLTIHNICYDDLRILFSTFDDIGINYELNKEEKTLKISKIKNNNLNNVILKTEPYPGFPTDLQPQISVLLSLIKGKSTITETIFKSRFNHIDELNRMGANIRLEDNTAIIDGVDKLTGAPIEATDLRASAALLIAGLLAEGETIISNVDHIFRGYEKLEEKLNKMGLKMTYID